MLTDIRTLSKGAFMHRVSPGTLVYNDLTSLDQLSAIPGLRPAALVVASVVSHPKPGRFTCDAGQRAFPPTPVCQLRCAGSPGLDPFEAQRRALRFIA